MILSGGRPRIPGFHRLPRGLGVAALTALTVVPLAALPASAAPAAPTAYAAFGSAQPLAWGSPPSAPVGAMRVPFVEGFSNNTPTGIANSTSHLAGPDDRGTATLAGEEINGLVCSGYPERACRGPFLARAEARHNGPKPAHAEQSASFAGKDGKFPGGVKALTECGGNCGDQFIRSHGTASGPAGAIPGYVSIGSSLATQDLSVDDKGRLVSSATSELKDVFIGPKDEVTGHWPVRFSRLVASAEALGAGRESTKDGKAKLFVTDFFILGNRVEFDRDGVLRLAGGGPSEQEAYDGAKFWLQELKKSHIRLGLPDFNAQVAKTPTHVIVETQGLRVFFEGGAVPAGLDSPLELGDATAVVAAVDSDRNIQVREKPNGGMTVETTAPATAPVAAAGPGKTVNPPTGPKAQEPAGTSRPPAASKGEPGAVAPPPPNVPQSPAPVRPDPASPPAGSPDAAAAPAAENSEPAAASDPPAGLDDPNKTALPSLDDVRRDLGLRGAQSVSRAFGAFLGLGLILPLARVLIRRLG